MHITDSRLGRAWVVSVSGRLDSSTTMAFEAHCDQLVAAGATVFVLDFQALGYINSFALRCLILLHKKVKPLGGQVIICGAAGTTKEVLDSLGFAEMFPITDTLEQAASLVG